MAYNKYLLAMFDLRGELGESFLLGSCAVFEHRCQQVHDAFVCFRRESLRVRI